MCMSFSYITLPNLIIILLPASWRMRQVQFILAAQFNSGRLYQVTIIRIYLTLLTNLLPHSSTLQVISLSLSHCVPNVILYMVRCTCLVWLHRLSTFKTKYGSSPSTASRNRSSVPNPNKDIKRENTAGSCRCRSWFPRVAAHGNSADRDPKESHISGFRKRRNRSY